MKRPNCLNCGKPLRPRYDTLCSTCGKPDHFHPFQSGGKGREGACDAPIGLSSHQNSTNTLKSLRGFGNYSDNAFCGLNCGYKWAIKKVGKR